MLNNFKNNIRKQSLNINLEELNMLTQEFKSEYINMVREKQDFADQKVQNSVT